MLGGGIINNAEALMHEKRPLFTGLHVKLDNDNAIARY